MSETKGAPDAVEILRGAVGRIFDEIIASEEAVLAERQRHAEEVATLEERVRFLEADNRRLHAWSVTDEGTITSLRDQLRRVEGERDRMQQRAAEVMRELTARRALDADVMACAEVIAAPARKMAEELARNYSRFPPVPMSPLEQRAMRLLAADFLREGGE